MNSFARFTICSTIFLTLLFLLSPTSTATAAGTVTCAQITQIPQAECEALREIVQWSNGGTFLDWFSSVKPCDWATSAPDLPYSSLRCNADETNIEELYLEQLTGLRAMPPSIAAFKHLKALSINGTSLWELPPEIGQLDNLELLVIGRLFPRQSRGGSCCGPRPTYYMGNKNLTSLPSAIGSLSKLRAIRIGYNQNLSELAPELGTLTQLTGLAIANSPALVSLPDTIGNLPALNGLLLENNESLSSLPATLNQLQSLEHISILGNQSLTELPAGFTPHNFRKRPTFRVDIPVAGSDGEVPRYTCADVWHISAAECAYLESLYAQGAGRQGYRKQHEWFTSTNPCQWGGSVSGPNIASFTDEVVCQNDVNYVTGLRLQHERSIRSLDGISALPNLRKLSIEGIGIREIPDEIGRLSKLELLNVVSNNELVGVSAEVGKLQQMKNLQIVGNNNLKSVPTALARENFPKIEIWRITAPLIDQAETSNPSDCTFPASGPWPPCATGGGGSNPTPAADNCIIPPSGPWPACATGGATPVQPTPGACIIPDSGPWPPCATGGVAPPAKPQPCVIPASGPWPACARSL